MSLVELDRDGRVATLTLNRPESLNALSPPLLDELRGHLLSLDADPTVGAVILTGAGRAFAAGADISQMLGRTAEQARAYAALGHEVGRLLEAIRPATIAAVNGFAFGGGCEMALACDVRYASDRAVFGQPEVKLGLIPGWGGTQRLSRVAGPGLAAEMVLSGRSIDAARAFAVGLVQRVVPGDELLAAAGALAAEIAAQGPLAVAAARQMLRRAHGGDHDARLDAEADAFAALFASADAQEGLAAFLEKRPPVFIGE